MAAAGSGPPGIGNGSAEGRPASWASRERERGGFAASGDGLPRRHEAVEVERGEQVAVAPGVTVRERDVGVEGRVRRDVRRAALGVERQLECVAAKNEASRVPVQHAVAGRVAAGVDERDARQDLGARAERVRHPERLRERKLRVLRDDGRREALGDAPRRAEHVAVREREHVHAAEALDLVQGGVIDPAGAFPVDVSGLGLNQPARRPDAQRGRRLDRPDAVEHFADGRLVEARDLAG